MAGGLLGQLEQNDREAVLGLMDILRYDQDAIIIGQEDDSDDVFIVFKGIARATLFSADGRVVAYRDMEEGALFGELAAIDGLPRSASVVAVGPVELGRMTAARFRELVMANSRVAWAVIEHLTAQSRAMTARIFEFSTMLVRERLVNELLRLAVDAEGGPDGPVIQPAPTHFTLSARISTHREAVSREMSRLSKQGILSKRGDTLVIHRLDLLELEAARRDEV